MRNIQNPPSPHAGYFEDFLKYDEYGKSIPVIMKIKIIHMVQEHFTELFRHESELLMDFGDMIHLGQINGKHFLLLIETDLIVFKKGVSPSKFHQPDYLHEIIEKSVLL
ncbi:DUF3898 domain-containing protein [Bacillus toyonensis]|uniref:DUF3898 domain-containing protein n=1 Tax=Bacillus toyonensis TaxID=155322 RepID=UPI00296FA96F|nr:DUF3898 domain-containing protein [Bacillus toyonensis]